MPTTALPYGAHIDEVKARIVEVASQSFREKGLRDVTMDEIAHQLSMSKRTLYQLFTDKEDLLLACVKKHFREEDEMLGSIYAEKNNVMGLLLVVFEINMRQMDNKNLSNIGDCVKYPRVIAFFEENKKAREAEAVAFLEGGKEEGIFLKSVNFHIVYSELAHSFKNLLEGGLLKRYSFREIFFNTVVPYLRGCATVEGIKIIDDFMEEMKKKLGLQ